MKKHLIIGGAGFIGSCLSRKLYKLGQKVVVVDNIALPPKNRAGFKFYNIDVEKAGKINKIFLKEKPYCVYHLAGAINLRKQVSDASFQKDLNFLGRTKIILDAMRMAKSKKIIFASSGGAIYENAKVVPTPEDYFSHPKSLYGLANLAIEKYIEEYCKEYNLKYTILRLSNVYGPCQWKGGIIPSIFESILKGKKPVIYGSGNQTRDFVYVEDVADVLAGVSSKGSGQIYNFGSGKEVSINKVFEMIKNITNSSVLSQYKKMQRQETERSALDIKKIKKDLNWSPKINMVEGLKRTFEFYEKK